MTRRQCLGLAPAVSGRHGVGHGVEGEPVRLVQLGCEPDLRVHDAVGSEVDHCFGGDALDRFGGLHHRQRVLERGEVLEDVARVGAAREPLLERRRIRRRQRPADLVGQLEHGRRAQPAVEVVVQQDLGRGPNDAA